MIRSFPKLPKKRLNIIKINEKYFFEEDIYTEDGIDAFSDDDQISLEEEAFMKGYLSA